MAMKKSDAINMAHDIRLIVDALVSEGFDEEEATAFAMELFVASAGRNTTLL